MAELRYGADLTLVLAGVVGDDSSEEQGVLELRALYLLKYMYIRLGRKFGSDKLAVEKLPCDMKC